MDSLETKQKGRPLLLGEELDTSVQEYVSSLRIAGEVVNTVVVRAAVEGIISLPEISPNLLPMVDTLTLLKAGQCPYLTEWDM